MPGWNRTPAQRAPSIATPSWFTEDPNIGCSWPLLALSQQSRFHALWAWTAEPRAGASSDREASPRFVPAGRSGCAAPRAPADRHGQAIRGRRSSAGRRACAPEPHRGPFPAPGTRRRCADRSHVARPMNVATSGWGIGRWSFTKKRIGGERFCESQSIVGAWRSQPQNSAADDGRRARRSRSAAGGGTSRRTWRRQSAGAPSGAGRIRLPGLAPTIRGC